MFDLKSEIDKATQETLAEWAKTVQEPTRQQLDALDASRYRWVLEQMDNRKWGHLPFHSGNDYDAIAMAPEINAFIDSAILAESKRVKEGE